MSRLILASGTQSENASFYWPNDYWPYEPGSTIVVNLNEKADLQLARGIRVILGDFQPCCFVRVPALLGSDFTVSMALCVPNSSPAPARPTLALLKGIASLIAKEMGDEIGVLVNNPAEHTVATGMTSFLDRVRRDSSMRMALDGQLNMLAHSAGLAEACRMSGGHPDADIGFFPTLSLPTSLRQLMQHTLQSGVTSPAVEMCTNREGKLFHFALRATPLRPLDATSDVLDITIARLPAVLGRPDLLAERRSNAAEVSCDFLFESLIRRSSLHSRNGTSYITVRAWRSSIKKHQILALKSVKRNHPAALASRIGDDLAADIKRLVGTSTFKFVVPIPCGHSAPDKCLASAIARDVASRLGMLHINAFAHLCQSGSSHPLTNPRRPKLWPIQAVPGPAILVDDVATSGSHMEEAIRCLNSMGVDTFAVAWIGGETADA